MNIPAEIVRIDAAERAAELQAMVEAYVFGWSMVMVLILVCAALGHRWEAGR